MISITFKNVDGVTQITTKSTTNQHTNYTYKNYSPHKSTNVTTYINIKFYFLGLNMFLVPQVSVNFEISHSLKLYTNLVFYLYA